jgi:hypothetical protein
MTPVELVQQHAQIDNLLSLLELELDAQGTFQEPDGTRDVETWRKERTYED